MARKSRNRRRRYTPTKQKRRTRRINLSSYSVRSPKRRHVQYDSTNTKTRLSSKKRLKKKRVYPRNTNTTPKKIISLGAIRELLEGNTAKKLKRQEICEARKIRRKAIFFNNKAGRGGQKQAKWKLKSYVKC